MRGRTAAAVAIAATAMGVAGARQRRSERRRSSAASAQSQSEGRGYPIVIHRLDGFSTLYSASFAAVSEVLPSDLLHPVRTPTGGALVAVSLVEKRAITAGWGDDVAVLPPYAELLVGALVTRRPLSRVASLVAMLRVDPMLGVFPIQFPVTSGAWSEASRHEVGMPMFVADFALDLADPMRRRLVVSEADRLIVEVSLTPRGVPFELRQVLTFFGALDGELLAARSEMRSPARVRLGGATLTLGTEHPVALGLRGLAITPTALATCTFPSGTGALHRPTSIGSARAYASYPGLDRPQGRYTVRYPGTGPLPAGPSVATDAEEASLGFPAFD